MEIISKLHAAQASNSSVNDKLAILYDVQQKLFLKGDIPQVKLEVSHLWSIGYQCQFFR